MVQNDLMASYFQETTPEDLLTLVNALPVEAVEPVDISNMMVFLCSEESRFFTGNGVRVDVGGGATCAEAAPAAASVTQTGACLDEALDGPHSLAHRAPRDDRGRLPNYVSAKRAMLALALHGPSAAGLLC